MNISALPRLSKNVKVRGELAPLWAPARADHGVASAHCGCPPASGLESLSASLAICDRSATLIPVMPPCRTPCRRSGSLIVVDNHHRVFDVTEEADARVTDLDGLLPDLILARGDAGVQRFGHARMLDKIGEFFKMAHGGNPLAPADAANCVNRVDPKRGGRPPTAGCHLAARACHYHTAGSAKCWGHG